jgi:hypothetical protein
MKKMLACALGILALASWIGPARAADKGGHPPGYASVNAACAASCDPCQPEEEKKSLFQRLCSCFKKKPKDEGCEPPKCEAPKCEAPKCDPCCEEEKKPSMRERICACFKKKPKDEGCEPPKCEAPKCEPPKCDAPKCDPCAEEEKKESLFKRLCSKFKKKPKEEEQHDCCPAGHPIMMPAGAGPKAEQIPAPMPKDKDAGEKKE